MPQTGQTFVVDPLVAPDVVGLTYDDGVAALQAVYCDGTSVTPFGVINFQDPPANSDVAAGTIFTLITTFGPAWASRLGLVSHSFHWLINSDGTVDGNYPDDGKP